MPRLMKVVQRTPQHLPTQCVMINASSDHCYPRRSWHSTTGDGAGGGGGDGDVRGGGGGDGGDDDDVLVVVAGAADVAVAAAAAVVAFADDRGALRVLRALHALRAPRALRLSRSGMIVSPPHTKRSDSCRRT